MRVLLVDDDEQMLEALTHSIEAEWPDAEAVRATNATEAMRGFASNDPDMVLLDIGLPGESGYEVLRRIRRISDVPVIMITGRGIDMDEVRGLQLGADDFLNKPFTQSVLIARMKSR